MRHHEQHTLDLIAHDLAASDPDLARELSVREPHTRRSRSPDAWIRRATITAIWLIGIACGATLLGLGLADNTELTTALGAAITAAILATGVLITYRQHHHPGQPPPRRPD